MNRTPETDFGREVITLLTEALSALLGGVNKLSAVNARWIDLNSLEYLIEDAKGQALAALKSGEAYCAIPILKRGDCFTLSTNETDLDEEGQERITSAGMVWVVQEREPECNPLMQYAVHCPQTGAVIHITHAELAECGYGTIGNRDLLELKDVSVWDEGEDVSTAMLDHRTGIVTASVVADVPILVSSDGVCTDVMIRVRCGENAQWKFTVSRDCQSGEITDLEPEFSLNGSEGFDFVENGPPKEVWDAFQAMRAKAILSLVQERE